MLLYRLISWLLISAIGWVVFFFVFRTENTGSSDDDAPTGPLPALGSPQPWNNPTESALQGPLPRRSSPRANDRERRLADIVLPWRPRQRATRRGRTGAGTGGFPTPRLPATRQRAAARAAHPATRPTLLHQAHGLGMLIGSLHCIDMLVSGCTMDAMSAATFGLAPK